VEESTGPDITDERKQGGWGDAASQAMKKEMDILKKATNFGNSLGLKTTLGGLLTGRVEVARGCIEEGDEEETNRGPIKGGGGWSMGLSD